MQTIYDAFTVQTPEGTVEYVPERSNAPRGTPRRRLPVQRWGAVWGAQIFVGLNVGDEEVWSPEQVRDAILAFRSNQLFQWVKHKQLSPADIAKIEVGGSVRPQLGFWRKLGASGGKERSVSINIESLAGESAGVAETAQGPQISGEFIEHMSELIYELAYKFEQDSVLAQIHQHGVVLDTLAALTEPL